MNPYDEMNELTQKYDAQNCGRFPREEAIEACQRYRELLAKDEGRDEDWYYIDICDTEPNVVNLWDNDTESRLSVMVQFPKDEDGNYIVDWSDLTEFEKEEFRACWECESDLESHTPWGMPWMWSRDPFPCRGKSAGEWAGEWWMKCFPEMDELNRESGRHYDNQLGDWVEDEADDEDED